MIRASIQVLSMLCTSASSAAPGPNRSARPEHFFQRLTRVAEKIHFSGHARESLLEGGRIGARIVNQEHAVTAVEHPQRDVARQLAPGRNPFQERPHIILHPAAVGIIEVEIIRQPGKCLARKWKHIGKSRGGPEIRNAVLLGMHEVRRKAIAPHAPATQRRREMIERRQQLRHGLVFGRVFAGEAVQQVPLDHHARLGKPLQRLQILNGRRSLVDTPQQGSTEGFDAELHPGHSRRTQEFDLCAAHGGPHFKHESYAEAGFLQERQQRGVIALVEDVVGRAGTPNLAAFGQVTQLLDDPLGRLAAIG